MEGRIESQTETGEEQAAAGNAGTAGTIGGATEEEQLRAEVEARMRAAVRVLIIDNEVETADRLVMLLERAGYEADIATDGASALVLVERFRPHLVILGPIANTVNSTEFTRLLRAAPMEAAETGLETGTASSGGAGLEVPILYLLDRAHLLQQRMQKLRDTPMSEAIFKPIDERELLDKVARTLLNKG
jgi:CheY-like chemotaxis protein